MRTTLCTYGAPESAFLITALNEVVRYFRLPFFGRAGATDADIIDAQAALEATYQILLSTLSGADLIHGLGEMNAGRMFSPEYAVLGSEIVDMAKITMQGIEINDETLPLDLIERVGPKATYISERHTLNHFREIWVPSVLDRSMIKNDDVKRCHDLVNEKTLKILDTHRSKPLPEDMVKELEQLQQSWLERVGLNGFPEKK
jgi:trimethylamine--corrinoid protein Co-methyltransferase